MKDLLIVGAGGFGREVAWLVERINQVTPKWNLLGFIDDQAKSIMNVNYPIVGTTADITNYPNAYLVCAVGNSQTRKKIIQKIHLISPFQKFAVLIDPNAIYSDTVQFGEGSIICAGSILTVNIKIGRHVIINLDCTVGHDAILDDYNTLYPSVNISGNVHSAFCVEFGTGMQVIQGIDICENVIIGAGSTVIRNINEPGVYVGSPAKKK